MTCVSWVINILCLEIFVCCVNDTIRAQSYSCELLMSTVSAPSWWVFSSSFMCTSYWYLQYELTMPSIFYIVYKWEEQEPGI